MVSQIKQQGFTIVELLIVIVVIAILAALSYVGYTSITARAKDSTAQASAKAVKDAAQVFQGAHGSYPTTKTHFTTGIPTGGNAADAVAKLPNDIDFKTGATAPVATDSEKTVRVLTCTGGMRIEYFKYSSNALQTMDVGNPTSCGETGIS